MKSRGFLTPMSPDGKPGEVIEMQFNDEAPRQFVAPVSYVAEQALPDAATTELEKERDALIASLPALKGGARAKVEHRIRVLEREITAARSVEESERRKQEREKERQRQQVGADSPFSRNEAPTVKNAQTFAELVAGVAALVKPAVKKVSEMDWEKHLRELDERLAKRALEALRGGKLPLAETGKPQAGPAGHGANTCCTGRYLCTSCQAKAAAA